MQIKVIFFCNKGSKWREKGSMARKNANKFAHIEKMLYFCRLWMKRTQ